MISLPLPADDENMVKLCAEHRPCHDQKERLNLLLLSISLFMIIAGSRILVLKYFGTDLPWFDQWGEGTSLYKSYANGTLTVAAFFEPCNEHRIVFARLLSLAEFILNGLWDNQLQTVINALIYAFTGVLLFRMVSRHLFGLSRIFWILAVAVTFSAPYGWENALWGFQSQFYLLVLFSLIVLNFCSLENRSGFKWLLFLAAIQISALFTMASGLMASVAVLGMYLLVGVRNRQDRGVLRELACKSAIACLVVALGYAIFFHVPSHDKLRAQSALEFIWVLAHSASWPNVESAVWWCVNWLPFLVLLPVYLFGQTEDRWLNRFAMAMGIWVLLQEAATAFSRAPLALTSKYSDLIALGIPVNVMAMIILYRSLNLRLRRGVIIVAVIWAGTNAWYLAGISDYSIKEPLHMRSYFFDIQTRKTRAYLMSGNLEMLIPEEKYSIPMRDPVKYAEILQDPYINSILPRSINYRASVEGIPRAYLSRWADLMLAISLPLLLIGCFSMIILFILGMFTKTFSKRSCNGEG